MDILCSTGGHYSGQQQDSRKQHAKEHERIQSLIRNRVDAKEGDEIRYHIFLTRVLFDKDRLNQ